MLNYRILLVCLMCATAPALNEPAHGDEAVIPAASEQVVIQSTVTNGFIHPGIGLTKDILENARRQVIAKKEPWYSGFQVLAADPQSSKTVNCRNESPTRPGCPDVDAFDNKGIEYRLGQDSARAKLQTLMYIFTGEEVYRANAMNIVRVWSHMDPAKYKAYPECYIHASYPIQDLITAAELLRNTSTQDPKLAWTEEDTQNFANNFAYPATKTFSDGNGWFMNQSGYPLSACIASDIFRSDRDNYARHVEWFTVSKSAPNKGWAFSIQNLVRRVETNAITGEKVAKPVVQIVEMGRDQAHGGDDVDILMNIARQLNAQNTKVDPVAGTISTAPDAVGPYEFLDDRILAGANYFWRFMLGYDTPWIPTPSDMTPDGKINQIYPRLADNYRGRLAAREFVNNWDAYYYYAFKKGVNLAEKAPYFNEAFNKRIITSLTDWISVPANATGDALRVPPRGVPLDTVEVEQRITPLSDKVTVVNDKDGGYVRISPSPQGTRLALLSSSTADKSIALRMRSTGPAEIALSGMAKPWLLPDTQNQWRTVTYQRGDLERYLDIIFFTVKGAPSAKLDIDTLTRAGADKLAPPAFRSGNDETKLIAAAGVPLNLDLSASDAKSRTLTIGSLDKPQGSALDAGTGEFTWTPAKPGDYSFIVTAANDDSVTAKRVSVSVAADRAAAVRQVTAAHQDIPYVSATARKWDEALRDINALDKHADAQLFAAKLTQLQAALMGLQPLTPTLADGSMDYPKIASANIGPLVSLLADGNDDTFTGSKDENFLLDFGANYRVTVSAFAMEGRLNFEVRGQDMVLFGSNDGKDWTQLTDAISTPPVELTRLNVKPDLANQPFRYLKIQKAYRRASPLFETAELRIYGQRQEVE